MIRSEPLADEYTAGNMTIQGGKTPHNANLPGRWREALVKSRLLNAGLPQGWINPLERDILPSIGGGREARCLF